MTWNTDDIGIRRFTSPDAPGWVLTIYPEVQGIYVDTGSADTEVEVTADGIEVFGEVSRGGYTGYEGVRFTIPWVIMREIVRFQDSVQSQG